MLITYNFKPENIFAAVHELIRMTFPGSTLTAETENIAADINIKITMEQENDRLICWGVIREKAHTTELSNEFLLVDENNYRNEINRNIRRFAFMLLSNHQGKPISNYGILTGVRPVKLVHRFIDDNYSADEIINILQNDFYLHPEKAKLLTEVAFNNREFLLSKEAAPKLISVYIGIPYCPTRCYYCSFPGAVLKNYETEIIPFLEVLLEEIKIIGSYLQARDIKVQTIYIGGGTPTILSDGDMTKLIETINDYLVSDSTIEITVEAGRPDTLTPGKLLILKEGGVSRVCINPQTMNDKTLQLIGRQHNEREVIDAVELARNTGFKQINMDIIVGLPGENKPEYMYTLKQVLNLLPENLTLHTLALKRGSTMAEKEGKNMEMRISQVEEGVKLFTQVLYEAGYLPYYLYRQKYMRGDMENIGFSKPDNYCIYNIQMIEERQTIIGIGGGSASKFVNPIDWSLSSIYNPKDPKTYLHMVQELANRKVDKLRGLN